ncbi:MAG: precorrin-8X methylmutase [Desulfobacterota bacterium]|nr:precorrin-8X methylmutase [Thermodesulfobacteriota bacterium]MDW8001284.1 precorrin-8X methylmutase [Deltaproteobacteria bacterium]
MSVCDTSKKRPMILDILHGPLTGEEIENLSFMRIEKEAPPHTFSSDEWQIVRRMIHATGDMSIMDYVRFSNDAIKIAKEALRKGVPIYVDSKMIRHGISIGRLKAMNLAYTEELIFCHIDDEDVHFESLRSSIPRSVIAIRKARPIIDGGIVIIGNSPLALLELNRLIMEEKKRPSFVIAMPVGFVHVNESKEEFLSLGIPHIMVAGKRGGSTLAISALHGLCTRDSDANTSKSEERQPLEKIEGISSVGIILMGHGSRVPNAGRYMERVADELKRKYGYENVSVCYVSRLGPHFPEVFEKLVKEGLKTIVVIPYFLHEGLHLVVDVPEMMLKEAEKYPDVKLILGKGLGFDEVLVDLVQKRIKESLNLKDIRGTVVPKRESFPIPAGQEEFVPMSPEEVKAYYSMIRKTKKES